MKFGFARSDLTVVVDGVTLKPELALGGWVAFVRMGRMQWSWATLCWPRMRLVP
jgi:hypothetical protein